MTIHVITELFGKMVAPEGGIWKYCVAAIAALGQFLLPVEVGPKLAGGVLALVILDTLTGMVASAVTGKAISSAKFGRLLVKLGGYCSVVIVFAIATSIFNWPGGKDFSVTFVLGICGFREAVSVLENCDRMGMKFTRFIKILRDRDPEKGE